MLGRMESLIEKGHEETLLEDKNAQDFDLSDSYMGTYLCKTLQNGAFSFAYVVDYTVWLNLFFKRKKNTKGLLTLNLSLSGSVKFSQKHKGKKFPIHIDVLILVLFFTQNT